MLRLRDFVNGYYASHASQYQSLDDSYHTFVWALLSQHTSVRIGLVSEEQLAQVYIPPFSKTKKNATIEIDSREHGFKPIQDVAAYSLQELVHTYGDQLRIAVDPATCLEALTGLHTKVHNLQISKLEALTESLSQPSKLTPTVYACLQLIARSRETGLSVLDLGRKSGYDQKTCFYIVKTLVELDLMYVQMRLRLSKRWHSKVQNRVKLRRGGASMNFCVHKYFYERSATWREVREEELRPQADPTVMELTLPGNTDNLENITSITTDFSPIDTRHLSNLNILRQRLTAYLRQSEDGVRPYHNIAVKIVGTLSYLLCLRQTDFIQQGFRPRSRTDRRFFIARLKELVAEGTIEKVAITDKTISEVAPSRQLGLRLARTGSSRNSMAILGTNTLEFEESDMIDEDLLDGVWCSSSNLVNFLRTNYEQTTDRCTNLFKLNSTLHRQIVEILNSSGSSGMTLQVGPSALN